MYESLVSKTVPYTAKQTVAVEIQESLAELEALADKVETFCRNKLAPITQEKVAMEDPRLSEATITTPYPPLFAEYRSTIRIIELSLLHIEKMLQMTEI